MLNSNRKQVVFTYFKVHVRDAEKMKKVEEGRQRLADDFTAFHIRGASLFLPVFVEQFTFMTPWEGEYVHGEHWAMDVEMQKAILASLWALDESVTITRWEKCVEYDDETTLEEAA